MLIVLWIKYSIAFELKIILTYEMAN